MFKFEKKSFTESIDHWWKIFDFFTECIDPSAKDCFLPMTIDQIDVFCRQSIIGINPIDVFFTIGAQQCIYLSSNLPEYLSKLTIYNNFFFAVSYMSKYECM
jgi:hypothetical protein